MAQKKSFNSFMTYYSIDLLCNFNTQNCKLSGPTLAKEAILAKFSFSKNNLLFFSDSRMK